jgi:iron(III) transport system ATP-binding protein
MRFEIRRLHDEFKITTVYVTHDQSEAMVTSDRIVVMNKGKIEQVGTPEEIYRRPATVFVADFIGSANFLDPVGVTVLGDRARVDVLGSQRELPRRAGGGGGGRNHVVLVRPESVQLRRSSAEVADGESVLGGRGRVLRAVFYGSMVEYEIDTDAGTIIAVVSDPDPEEILAEDDLVEVDFPRDRGWLLPA